MCFRLWCQLSGEMCSCCWTFAGAHGGDGADGFRYISDWISGWMMVTVDAWKNDDANFMVFPNCLYSHLNKQKYTNIGIGIIISSYRFYIIGIPTIPTITFPRSRTSNPQHLSVKTTLSCRFTRLLSRFNAMLSGKKTGNQCVCHKHLLYRVWLVFIYYGFTMVYYGLLWSFPSSH